MQLLWDGFSGAIKLLAERDNLVLAATWRSLWISGLAVSLASLLGVAIGLFLARARFFGRVAVLIAFRAGMSVPTVLIGLLCYAMLSRRGPFGGIDLLYTPWAIIIGEFFLALPIIVTWTHGSIAALDSRVAETAITLGAGRSRRCFTYLSEARMGISLSILSAFARCFTELGVAIMVGGNIKYQTRTLTTATALETARGEFERGVAMSLVLLFVAVFVTIVIAAIGRNEQET